MSEVSTRGTSADLENQVALLGCESDRAILTRRPCQTDVNHVRFRRHITPDVESGIATGGAIYSIK